MKALAICGNMKAIVLESRCVVVFRPVGELEMRSDRGTAGSNEIGG